jgi:hypothetical protein
MAKIRPDSRRPRRLPQASRTTNPTAITTRHGSSTWKAEVRAAVPAETLTATVRM